MSSKSLGASCSDVTTGSVGPPPVVSGGEDDSSSVTQSQTTGGDATSGAAADCSMATDSSETGDSPRDYNKLKYHSSKMDLNLMILRDQMTNLQSSGSSLSRQLASMYRTFQEIKDDDEGGDADSEYESDDEKRPDDVRDAVDTEDDVNKMSDFEKDYSEPKFKRSISTGSRGKKPKNGSREPKTNEVTASEGNHRKHSKSSSMDGSGESCQESDSECSQCLCCNSIASYSGTPWRYVSRGDGSTMDEDSDSSEYFSDESEYSTTTCTSLPSDIHKRHSPFYCPSEGKPDDNDEGRFEDAEPVVDLRMSPLGCESPRKCNSQPDLKSMLDKSESTKDEKSDKMDTGSVKPDTEEKVSAEAEGDQEEAVKASSLIGKFKEQEAKAKQDQIASIAKAKRVEELRRKNSEIRLKNEQKRKSEMEARMKNKTKQDFQLSPLAVENEDEKVNIKDRISSFEKQKQTQDKDKENTKLEQKVQLESGKSPNVERGTNTETDTGTVQHMPDVIPDVTEGNNDQEDLDKTHTGHHLHKSKSKLVKTTIEIPVACLPEQVVHPDPGTQANQPTMMTFQVRPADVDALGGPMIVSRIPKPKRKMSKTIVRLTSVESPTSVSEATLVPDNQNVQTVKKHSGHSHHVCPHCQKKSKPGESKRVIKVLQLQPVPENPDLPPMSPVHQAGDSTHFIQQQPGGGQVIQMIPSKRHGNMQRLESSQDGVVFRFNMGMPENAPLQVGDYIRIPIQPQQPQVRHQGGGVVIRTGGQPRRPKDVIQFSQSVPGGVIVQPSQSPTSGGVTVHMSQPGVRVISNQGGGVKLVFGS